MHQRKLGIRLLVGLTIIVSVLVITFSRPAPLTANNAETVIYNDGYTRLVRIVSKRDGYVGVINCFILQKRNSPVWEPIDLECK
jgi:hypothetical protein